MVPPLVPLSLARRRERAGDLDGLRRRARAACCRRSRRRARSCRCGVPIELASITPLVLMTESTTCRAAAAVSSTRPPLALIVPSLVTSDLSGWPVATSITLRRDLVVDRERDQLVAVDVEREAVAGGERHGAERRGDGAGVAHARRHQRREAAAGRGDACRG